MTYRRMLFALLGALTLCVAIAVFAASFGYFRSQEEVKASGRLSLYRSTVIAELERFSHLTYVLARDPFVMSSPQQQSHEALDARLASFSQQAGLDAIYLMDPTGLTISASNAGQSGSFVGQNYSFRPYFRQAAQGEQGRFYGIGTTTGLPGYFIADAVRDPSGGLSGVIAIKLDLTKLEQSWRDAGEQVFLTNHDGVVLLSYEPAWRYQTLQALTPAQRAQIETDRQFAGQPLTPLDWSARPGQRAVLAGADRIHLTSRILPHDWELHYFADDTPAVTRASLVTGLVMFLMAAWFILSQLRRTRQIGHALRVSEAEEAKLRETNERLAVEIEERKTAERRLHRTQGELERASRLAALGQLAASVTHELGQPIAAMRNHLAAAELGGKTTPNIVPHFTGLVERMEGITRQLKFFARNDKAQGFGEVDLRPAMQAALALVAVNLERIDVTPELIQPDMPVWVRGNQLRIEQVMTNILRNAIDAIEESDPRQIQIQLGQDDDTGWFEIRDNGHGLGQSTLADLEEPFVTTRESGRGMGLGLAISTSIVQEHDGQIIASNGPDGGAIFRVDLPAPQQDEHP